MLPVRAPARTASSQTSKGPERNIVTAPLRVVDAFESAPAARPVFKPLGRGATGRAIVTLQEQLVARGFLRAQDMASGKGVFGPRTEAAVRRLQLCHGLATTGLADPRTLRALTERPTPPANEITDAPTDRFAQCAGRPSETLTDDVTQPIALPLRRTTAAR